VITYAIIIERADDGGFGACVRIFRLRRARDSEEETIAEMREAIELHLAGMRRMACRYRTRARSARPRSPPTRPDRFPPFVVSLFVVSIFRITGRCRVSGAFA